jgi:anti-sigma-K factor RskA
MSEETPTVPTDPTDPTDPADPADPELDSLLGAYALDALDGNERARVDAYLRVNARARDEVDELRESAASLAATQSDAGAGPPAAWDQISRVIDAESGRPPSYPPRDPYDDLAERRARRSWRGIDWAVVVAVAATIVALALVAQVMSLTRRLDDARGTGDKAASAGFERAGHAHNARHGILSSDQGTQVARVVLLPDGSGYFKNDAMTPLDENHTYQLWAMSGSTDNPVAVSEGVLGPDPNAASFHASPGVTGFAITVEQAGGAPQPTQPPYAAATLT